MSKFKEGDRVRLIKELITPLRFEDVRTGDEITVEGPDLTITGIAYKPGNPACVKIKGVSGAFHSFNGNRARSAYCGEVTLTSHTPAPPAWHAALVIRARRRYTDLEFFLHHPTGGWTDEEGLVWDSVDLLDVTVVAGPDGEVVR